MKGNPPPTSPDDEKRAQIITGLRAFAEFIRQNPHLPIPSLITVNYSVRGEDDDSERTEVDRIAAILGVATSYKFARAFYSAVRRFDGVEYEAVAITREEMDQYRAGMSYIDSVRPE
ncbi:hypothetical protein [Actinomadura craniellae]|uniref:hypothetical protein n=1 Tax=Actinomadura craniellae TaxID=2231787 RepID=UPI0011BD7D4C|nr:hypothetical protein [Actinomadura craniellae]